MCCRRSVSIVLADTEAGLRPVSVTVISPESNFNVTTIAADIRTESLSWLSDVERLTPLAPPVCWGFSVSGGLCFRCLNVAHRFTDTWWDLNSHHTAAGWGALCEDIQTLWWRKVSSASLTKPSDASWHIFTGGALNFSVRRFGHTCWL